MSYKIQYSPQFNEKYSKRRKTNKIWKGLLATGAVIFMMWILTNNSFRGFLKEIIIPGKAEVTVAAAEAMVQNLKDGVAVRDAISAFCIQVLEQAHAY